MTKECILEIDLSRYLDKELPPRGRERVAAHLRECPGCREKLADLERENKYIKEWFDPGDGLPGLLPGVMAEIGAKKRPTPARWGLAAAAALFALVVFSLFLLLQPPAPGTGTKSESRVLVQSARVEGADAQPHIFDTRDSDTTFIWLEKI